MRVFVSGKSRGMEREREAVRDVIEHFGFECVVSEQSGASSVTPVDWCVSQARQCDIFIALLGPLYGFVPEPGGPGDLFDGKNSISKIEFEEAMRNDKPVLIYEDKSAATKCEPAQEEFIKGIKDFYDGLFVRQYDSADDLKAHLKLDLPNLLTDLVRGKFWNSRAAVPSVHVYKNKEEMYRAAGNIMVEAILANMWPCLSVSAGKTTSGVYNAFVNDPRLANCASLENTIFVLQTEYIGCLPENQNSCRALIENSLINRLPRKSTQQHIFPPGCVGSDTFESKCLDIDARLNHRRMNLSILGVSPLGEVLCIDPQESSTKNLLEQKTSVSAIDPNSIPFLNPRPVVPYAITIGIGNLIKQSDKIVVVAEGDRKANIVRRICFGSPSPTVPVTLFRNHPHFEVLVDAGAASQLPKSGCDNIEYHK